MMQDDRVNLRWRTVALTAVVLAVGASVLAAIVSSIREVDALSVIALALAVIAFVVQIIVYIAQADAAAKQQIQASDVYGKTIAALATIEEKAEGTRTTVNTLSDRLLDAAIGKALPEAESEGSPVGSEEFADNVSRIVREILNSHGSVSLSSITRSSSRPPKIADGTMWKMPPEEQAIAAADLLSGLSESQLSQMSRLALDQARSGGSEGTQIGPGIRALNPYSVKELHKRGLVVRKRVPWSTEPVFQLTELGKDAGRILIADDASFSPIKGVQEARRKLETYRADLEKRVAKPSQYEDIPIVED